MEILNWVVYCLFGAASVAIVEHLKKQKWRKQWWEGIVIGKYSYTYLGHHGFDASTRTGYAIELWCDQTVETKYATASLFPLSVWVSIGIGDYVIKKSGSDSVEKRAIHKEEAREVTHVLIERGLHPEKRLLRPDGSREEIRSQAARVLRQIGTPEAIEAVKKWS